MNNYLGRASQFLLCSWKPSCRRTSAAASDYVPDHNGRCRRHLPIINSLKESENWSKCTILLKCLYFG